jgi:hypothetical protein
MGLASQAQKQEVNNLTTFDDQRLHFGFTMAYSMLDFKVVHSNTGVKTDIAKLSPGFTLGMISNLRLAQDFDLRFLPGMTFGWRQMVYSFGPVANQNTSPTSIYFDFPLLLKYKARRMNNNRPYIIGGIAYRYDLVNRSKKINQNEMIKLKPLDSFIEIGMGWDTYLEYFRLSTEFKFSIGLRDIIDVAPSKADPIYTDAIDRLSSQIFTLSFHFE